MCFSLSWWLPNIEPWFLIFQWLECLSDYESKTFIFALKKKQKQKKKGNFFRYVEHCKIQCSFAGKRFGWWVWLETGPWRCVPSRLQLSALLLSCRNRISHCRSLSLCDRFLHFGWPIHRVSFTESYSLNSTTVSQMLDLKFVIKLF